MASSLPMRVEPEITKTQEDFTEKKKKQPYYLCMINLKVKGQHFTHTEFSSFFEVIVREPPWK